ncbi:MAG TPA: AMP-binding protein, partial [Thermoanaerobaculia bacterium]|nr:AMP-binding protein [Thermoanaerobaculia bacterium]
MSVHDSLRRPPFREPVPAPSGKAPARGSLIDLLRLRAAERPLRPALTFLADGERPAGQLTYADLDLQARRVGALLQRQARPGDRVVLMLPPGLEFVAAFFGCLYAGVVAVPAYPPRSSRSPGRLLSIVGDARPRWGLTTPLLRSRLADLLAGADLRDVRWLTAEEAEPGEETGWQEPEVSEGTLAFLQYTSGSTAAPKGVMVTHDAILRNEGMIQRAFGQSED